MSVAPRYWFCNAFHRDFISINAGYAHFNVAGNAYPVAWMYPQVRDTRYQGDAIADSALHVRHIQIVGFASFDGRQSYNVRLAGERARTIKEYMQSSASL